MDTTVIDILWKQSKNGYLKPTVQIEPIESFGSIIKYVTGFNAKFIEENKIGLGSKIKIVVSGDIIPYISEVLGPSNLGVAQMPNCEFEWENNRIDIK
jgi:DNA ligase (NAD+)